uniref:Uncharacterized protein n=1 Tax=Anopheles coluzzii TaxID=1518534 RepID=A0A8W7PR96_ANOCL
MGCSSSFTLDCASRSAPGSGPAPHSLPLSGLLRTFTGDRPLLSAPRPPPPPPLPAPTGPGSFFFCSFLIVFLHSSTSRVSRWTAFSLMARSTRMPRMVASRWASSLPWAWARLADGWRTAGTTTVAAAAVAASPVTSVCTKIERTLALAASRLRPLGSSSSSSSSPSTVASVCVKLAVLPLTVPAWLPMLASSSIWRMIFSFSFELISCRLSTCISRSAMCVSYFACTELKRACTSASIPCAFASCFRASASSWAIRCSSSRQVVEFEPSGSGLPVGDLLATRTVVFAQRPVHLGQRVVLELQTVVPLLRILQALLQLGNLPLEQPFLGPARAPIVRRVVRRRLRRAVAREPGTVRHYRHRLRRRLFRVVRRFDVLEPNLRFDCCRLIDVSPLCGRVFRRS